MRKHFFGVSAADRAMIVNAFLNAAASASVVHTYVLACGDFQVGDPSTGIFATIAVETTTCATKPFTNAFTIKYRSNPPDTVGTATNNIAGCAMMNPDRSGNLEQVMFGTDVVRKAFCDETDFPMPPANVGTDRRMYFRGWTLLHELLHTTSVGGAAGIMAQGPTDAMPYPGTVDFTYDQAAAGLLSPEQAARNSDSYANFAWEAFFQVICGKAAKSKVRTFNPDDFVDWDAMEAQGLMARSMVLKHKNKSQYRPPQARQAAPEPAVLPESANPNADPPSEPRKTTRPSSNALVARAPTKLKTQRKTAGKGVGRVIKLQKCPGCQQVPQAGAKQVAPKAGKVKGVLKKCKPREIFIPTVLLGKKVNPKAKKGTCVSMATTTPVPGTAKPAPGNQGAKPPVNKTPVTTPGQNKTSVKQPVPKKPVSKPTVPGTVPKTVPKKTTG